MSINRLSPEGKPSPDPRHLQRLAEDGSVREQSGPGSLAANASKGDQVALSETAKIIGDQPVPSGGLLPARLREVTERLASGFYDTDAVRDLVAQRVAADLGLPADG